MYGQQNRNVVQYMGSIMARNSFDANLTLELVEVLNASVLSCKDVVVILESVFTNQKSDKILIGTQVLEYLIKNCSKGFHHAANNEPFQKSIMSLLKRTRGKSSLFKDMSCNKDNWRKIEAKVLYLIQLWYDTFMLEQAKFEHIINNYKKLRAQGVTFPPRSVNQKNLIYVENQSPIFDNIQTIARSDQQKFAKRLKALGMNEARQKVQKSFQPVQRKTSSPTKKTNYVNIDDISEKIAILQSSDSADSEQVRQVIESMKKELEFGKVPENERQYWEEVKKAADQLIVEWEARNAQVVKLQQQKYLQKKLSLGRQKSKQEAPQNALLEVQQEPEPKVQTKKEQFNLLDL